MENNLIRVKMLGEFSMSSVHCEDAVTDRNNRSRKVLNLLEYLITFRSREIPQSEIIEYFWPEEDTDEPANTLKTLLHRAQSSLDQLGLGSGKDMIICRRGSYFWNKDYPLQVDAEEFETLCRQAEAASEDAEKLALLLAALELYKGDFLPKAADELWAVPIVTYYHSMYLTAVHQAVEMFSAQAAYDEVIALCQKAVKLYPFDEWLHLSMIQALVANGMRQAAQNHYSQVTELYLNKFGINPSPELTALYREINKTNKDTEINLHVIRSELMESVEQEGAYFCEYEFFKDLYRVEARAAIRTGEVVHIALLTVLDSKGKQLTRKQMNLTMERLKEVLSASTRHSDVYSRYSVSQYILMLPSATMEASEAVLQRISRNFRREYPHMNALLHYSVLPVIPSD